MLLGDLKCVLQLAAEISYGSFDVGAANWEN